MSVAKIKINDATPSCGHVSKHQKSVVDMDGEKSLPNFGAQEPSLLIESADSLLRAKPGDKTDQIVRVCQAPDYPKPV